MVKRTRFLWFIRSKLFLSWAKEYVFNGISWSGGRDDEKPPASFHPNAAVRDGPFPVCLPITAPSGGCAAHAPDVHSVRLRHRRQVMEHSEDADVLQVWSSRDARCPFTCHRDSEWILIWYRDAAPPLCEELLGKTIKCGLATPKLGEGGVAQSKAPEWSLGPRVTQLWRCANFVHWNKISLERDFEKSFW